MFLVELASVQSPKELVKPSPEGLSTGEPGLATQPVVTGAIVCRSVCYSVNNVNHFPTLSDLAHPFGFVSNRKRDFKKKNDDN